MCIVSFETQFQTISSSGSRINEESQLSKLECALSAGTGSIIATVSTTPIQASVVAIVAGLAARHSARITGSPYHRLQHRRATFDEVATLSVEGLNKSAIARVKQIAWNTVARWLEKAAHSCRRFNDRRIATLAVAGLQADEIRTIVGSKKHPIWIFTTIDVWSRLWPATVVGRRS
jgi:hypothetical protein